MEPALQNIMPGRKVGDFTECNKSASKTMHCIIPLVREVAAVDVQSVFEPFMTKGAAPLFRVAYGQEQVFEITSGAFHTLTHPDSALSMLDTLRYVAKFSWQNAIGSVVWETKSASLVALSLV